MKNSKLLQGILLFSGLIAAAYGAAILFSPIAFAASNGIDLSGQISLLNETRAPGGALMTSGLLMLAGVVVSKLRLAASIVATQLYLSYGLARWLSISVDGTPVDSLVLAAAMEVLIGILNLYAIWAYWQQDS